MLAADGELDAAGRAALQDFMVAHPALNGEYAAWQSLKLQPDSKLVYADKVALLRQEPKPRTIGFRPFAFAAAAAVIAALILIPALRQQGAEGPAIVHEFADPEPAVPVRDHYTDSLSQIGTSPERSKPRPTAKTGTVPDRTRIAKQVPAPVPVRESVRQDSVVAQISLRPDALVEKELPAPVVASSDVAPGAEVKPELPRPESERQPLITLAPENRQAFRLLKRAFEARIAQASSAAKTLTETALVIKLGHGSVNINL